jgi:hypothetical protein
MVHLTNTVSIRRKVPLSVAHLSRQGILVKVMILSPPTGYCISPALQYTHVEPLLRLKSSYGRPYEAQEHLGLRWMFSSYMSCDKRDVAQVE